MILHFGTIIITVKMEAAAHNLNKHKPNDNFD